MIKLDKLDCPEILRQNKEQWTADLMSYYSDDEKPPPSVATRYNHPEIKSALKDEVFSVVRMDCSASMASIALLTRPSRKVASSAQQSAWA